MVQDAGSSVAGTDPGASRNVPAIDGEESMSEQGFQSPRELLPARKRVPGSLRIFLGLLISLCCLVLVLRGVHWDAVAAILGGMRLLPLVAAVAVEFLTFWAIAARWQRLFTPHALPSKASLFEILTIAQLVNGVLPAKLGPLVRAYLAGQGESRGVAFALSTIVSEKLIEGISLLVVGIGLLPFVPLVEWLRPATWAGTMLLLVALGLVLWVAFKRETAARWIQLLRLLTSGKTRDRCWHLRSGRC
jgi:uncharacterized membrane protein YbhN (UPF0104 family)